MAFQENKRSKISLVYKRAKDWLFSASAENERFETLYLRLENCGCVAYGTDKVYVSSDDEGNHRRIGLTACQARSVCIRCGSKVQKRDQVEVESLLVKWSEDFSGWVGSLTTTLPNFRSEDLDDWGLMLDVEKYASDHFSRKGIRAIKKELGCDFHYVKRKESKYSRDRIHAHGHWALMFDAFTYARLLEKFGGDRVAIDMYISTIFHKFWDRSVRHGIIKAFGESEARKHYNLDRDWVVAKPRTEKVESDDGQVLTKIRGGIVFEGLYNKESLKKWASYISKEVCLSEAKDLSGKQRLKTSSYSWAGLLLHGDKLPWAKKSFLFHASLNRRKTLSYSTINGISIRKVLNVMVYPKSIIAKIRAGETRIDWEITAKLYHLHRGGPGEAKYDQKVDEAVESGEDLDLTGAPGYKRVTDDPEEIIKGFEEATMRRRKMLANVRVNQGHIYSPFVLELYYEGDYQLREEDHQALQQYLEDNPDDPTIKRFSLPSQKKFCP